MITLFVLLPVLVVVLVVARLVRMVVRPLRYGRRGGYGNGRRRGLGGSVMGILALLAVERLLGRRW